MITVPIAPFARTSARLASAFAVLLPVVAEAHRLDELLQATFVSVGTNHITLALSMTPGVDVSRQIIPLIDADHDGAISAKEASGYADRVRTNLFLAVDAKPLPLLLTSSSFPPVADMKEGLGTISLVFTASTPAFSTGTHRLRFRNNHQTNLSVFLANALVPESKSVSIVRQTRDFNQTTLEFDFSVTPASGASDPSAVVPAKPVLRPANPPKSIPPP